MHDSTILDRRLTCIERRLARLEASAGLPPEPDLPRRRDRAEPDVAPAAAPTPTDTATSVPPESEPPARDPVMARRS